MAHSKINWRQTADGIWERDFCPIEKFLHFATTASPLYNQWIVQSGVVLPRTNNLSVDAIKDAWLCLRYMHPLIGCSITATGFQYRVQDEDEILRWVEATVKVDRSGRSGQELAVAVQAPDSSELYFLPETREVFIQTRHELIDGVGCMMLLNNLLKALREGGSPKFSLKGQIARLAPSVAELMHAENPPYEVITGPQKYIAEYSVSEQIGLKLGPVNLDAASKPRRWAHEFSEAETAVMLRVCKQRGITITHAATAASSQASLDQSGQESGHLRSLFCVNVREFLPKPYNSPDYAVSAYFTIGLPKIPVSAAGDPLKLANEIKDFYNDTKFDSNNVAYAGPLLEGLEDAIREAAANDIPPNSTIVSSWGLADRYITEPYEDFWGNVTTATPTTGLFVYSAKNRLRLVLVYNSTFYGDDSMRGFMKGTVERLGKFLGLHIPSNIPVR
ncbi:hypothetical protein TWF696_002609 [Orbilia brochopaga]|uniref:Acyltransferase n=1 Tax=Orbilia brochopaga TaxID=3140254 RepID=A0AAV9U283_9PEZI